MDDENLELLISLTSLYLLLAAIDGEFNDVEELTIKEKINEWSPNLDTNSFDQIFKESAHTLRVSDRLSVFNDCAGIIKESFDVDNKINVIKDLLAIAISDGKIHNNEKEMINSLSEIWELSGDIDIDEYIKEVALKMLSKSPDDFLREQGFTEDDIEKVSLNINSEVVIETNDSKFESHSSLDSDKPRTLPNEIIAEVYKDASIYRAKIKDTENDITELIDNPAKLKYAFERSGLIRGKKGKDGNYKWRVIG